MLCLEGAGALSQFSLRHAPDTGNEPTVFSAVCIKGKDGNIARVLEGPVPSWKVMGIRTTSTPGSGVGLMGKTYGLPRFANSSFQSRFPFGTVELTDPKLPISVAITGWRSYESAATVTTASCAIRITNTNADTGMLARSPPTG